MPITVTTATSNTTTTIRATTCKSCITFWGSWGPILTNVSRFRKNVHHLFQNTCITFPKTCNTFSEVRITNFTNRPRFRKTFNQTNPT